MGDMTLPISDDGDRPPPWSLLMAGARASRASGGRSRSRSRRRDEETDPLSDIRFRVLSVRGRESLASHADPYWVIFSTPPHMRFMVGVHHCSWETLFTYLSERFSVDDRRYVSSGELAVQDLRPFAGLQNALAHFRMHRAATDTQPVSFFRYSSSLHLPPVGGVEQCLTYGP